MDTNLAYLETADPKELTVSELNRAIPLVRKNLDMARWDVVKFVQVYGDRANENENDPLHGTHWNLIAEVEDLSKHFHSLCYEYSSRKEMLETRAQVIAREEGGCEVYILEDYR